MRNYSNLSDLDFEYLCKDIMSKKLGVNLHRFGPGCDGGVDLVDDIAKKHIVVQVKHYTLTDTAKLIRDLKKEVTKIKAMNPVPKQYFVCCSKVLTSKCINTIYNLFSEYMSSTKNILDLQIIDDYLNEEENSDLLYSHFKLWIDSTNILQKMLTKEIILDSEVLKQDILAHEKLYVQTDAYDNALKILKKSNVIILVGSPGVGKTITSEMLALHYIANGYTLKYTSAVTDIQAIKRSLSNSDKTKEFILLDDCYGQAYFNMNETQCIELLKLIKFVSTKRNKKLVMNSRVTIFKEATNRDSDYGNMFDSGRIIKYVLDMDTISLFDKARIFYNHLFFHSVPDKYMDNVRLDRNYRSIVGHKNYNPRIVDYVTKKSVIDQIAPSDYCQFIMECLNNPDTVWENEYSNRLQLTDRILLNTLYSLTDTTISEDTLRQCYNNRIRLNPNVDSSVDQYSQSKRRLLDSMITIVAGVGTKKLISMANPSINDFIREYLKHNPNEVKHILENAMSIRQFNRLLESSEYSNQLKKMFEDTSILELLFESEQQRNSFISYYCVKLKLMNPSYTIYIKGFLKNPSTSEILPGFRLDVAQVFTCLLQEEFCHFYGLDILVRNINTLSEILQQLSFEYCCVLIRFAYDYYVDDDIEFFIQTTSEELNSAIDAEYGSVDASDYDIDIGEILNECSTTNMWGDRDYDKEEVIDMIEQEVRSLVKAEIDIHIQQLPFKLDIDDLSICVSGAQDLIDEYEKQDYYDYLYDDWRMDNHVQSDFDEVDAVFQR